MERYKLKRRRYIRVKGRIVAPAIMMTVVMVAACSSDECLDNKNALPLAGFYSSEEVPRQISIDSISIFGIGAPGDSILQDSVRGLTQSYLPFRIDREETSYVIQYLSGDLGRYHIADTITFSYDLKPWFVSSACGVSYDYGITSIETTHHVIDSVRCPYGEITNANIENLKIYFRVAESGGE